MEGIEVRYPVNSEDHGFTSITQRFARRRRYSRTL